MVVGAFGHTQKRHRPVSQSRDGIGPQENEAELVSGKTIRHRRAPRKAPMFPFRNQGVGRFAVGCTLQSAAQTFAFFTAHCYRRT